MSCECVTIVQSDHPSPKCSYDAVADILAMHFPCAPACALSSTRAPPRGGGSICWQEKQNLFRSLDTLKASYLPWHRRVPQLAAPGSGVKPTPACRLARGPSVGPGKAEMHLLFSPSTQLSAAPLVALCVGSASSTHL